MRSPISKQTLVAYLFDCGIDPVEAPDEFYALPALEWITGDFARALKADQVSEGLDQYVRGANNCNKFTRHAADLAARHFLRTPGRPQNSALAFGEFDFVKPDGNGESINLAVCRDENLHLLLVFFQPQTCQVITPQRKEYSLCSARFC